MEFSFPISKYQRIVNLALKNFLKKNKKILPSFNNYFVQKQHQLVHQYSLNGGKRLRPILSLIAYQATGGRELKKILPAVLAFEFFHNYTLVHDDIYDEDEKRRKRIANHVIFKNWFEKKFPNISSETVLYKNPASRFGVVAGIINGKYLYSLAALAISKADVSIEKKLAGFKILNDVFIYDNTGQAIDLSFEKNFKVKERDYYDMVFCKTAKLFQSAIEWGAVLAGANENQKESLKNYAKEMAIAFQIKDDLLDIASGGEKGRGIGSDIRKGKKTLLIIHGLKKADAKRKKFILKILGNQKALDKDIKKVISWLREMGSIDFCEKKAKEKIKRAIFCLKKANPPLKEKYKKFLEELAFFMLERKK